MSPWLEVLDQGVSVPLIKDDPITWIFPGLAQWHGTTLLGGARIAGGVDSLESQEEKKCRGLP
jgi:hypothetical protein